MRENADCRARRIKEERQSLDRKRACVKHLLCVRFCLINFHSISIQVAILLSILVMSNWREIKSFLLVQTANECQNLGLKTCALIPHYMYVLSPLYLWAAMNIIMV